MYTTSSLLLLLSTFTSALPSFAPTTRQASTCSVPTTFTLNNIFIFHPAAGNPYPAIISFSIIDNLNKGTSCSSTNTPNPSVPNLCENGNFQWTYDGTTLTIGETFTPCTNSTQTAQVFGDVDLHLFCTPTEPPIPTGFGERCTVLPKGWEDGTFTRDTPSAV